MKERLYMAKQNMKEKGRPYQTYTYYMAIPIMIIVFFVLAMLGVNVNSVGTITLIFSVIAHVNASKLKLISNKKYVGPILRYVNEIIGLFFIVFLFNLNYEALNFIVILTYIIQITSIVFFFLTASEIKKAYPTMKEDAKISRQEYLDEKRIYKEERNK